MEVMLRRSRFEPNKLPRCPARTSLSVDSVTTNRPRSDLATVSGKSYTRSTSRDDYSVCSTSRSARTRWSVCDRLNDVVVGLRAVPTSLADRRHAWAAELVRNLGETRGAEIDCVVLTFRESQTLNDAGTASWESSILLTGSSNSSRAHIDLAMLFVW